MKKLLVKGIDENERISKNLVKIKFLVKANKKLVAIAAVIMVLLASVLTISIISSNEELKKDQYIILNKRSKINSLDVKGQVESKNSIEICANTNNVGYPINKINVNVGDKVKAGDVLATLDTSQIEKDIEYAQALVETTSENLKIKVDIAKREYENLLKIKNDGQNQELVAAEANLNSSSITLGNAKKTYDNNMALFEAQAISQNEFGQSEDALKKAQSDYDKAVKTLEGIKSKLQVDLDTAKDNYKAAQAAINDNTKNIQLEMKQKQLEDCTIKATCDGIITAKNIEVGGFPSGMLFKIQDLNNVEVNVTIKEVDIPDIKIGQKAKIKTDSLKNQALEGEVSTIEPIAKSESKDALALKDDSIDKEAEYNVKIKIDEVSNKLRVGMNARVNIILDEKDDEYVISSSSIINDNDKHGIYVAEKQDGQYVIKEIPVNLGTEGDYDVEIIGDELYDGLIIISDPMKYKIGQVIKIKNAG